MAKIFFSDIQSITLNYHTPSHIYLAVGNGDILAGGGDRPLGEKLPEYFEVKTANGESYDLTNALELHRLVVEDYDQLERRSKELDKKIIDATCSDELFSYKEVSEPPSLSSPGEATVSRLLAQRDQLRPPPSQPRRRSQYCDEI